MVALPSVGFPVAAWLWSNGYSSADNSSSPTGNLRNFCNGTEYGFAQLTISVQQNAAGIEKLFQYWRHTLKVKLTMFLDSFWFYFPQKRQETTSLFFNNIKKCKGIL